MGYIRSAVDRFASIDPSSLSETLEVSFALERVELGLLIWTSARVRLLYHIKQTGAVRCGESWRMPPLPILPTLIDEALGCKS